MPGFFFTGILPAFSRIMLNMDSGDSGKLEQRDCGCCLDTLGFTTHLSNIRSYEKITSEGVTFLGSELLSLVEDILPERCGGQVGDYQLAEEEVQGFVRVNILVSPRLGEIDEEAVVRTVLDALGAESYGPRRRMHELWQQGNVLRVVRREPILTGRAKVLPLHLYQTSRLEAESGRIVTR
jgi:hypothetical protein